ncbi:MAG: hypothetical protein AAB305_02130, partial [Candidatus Zixiibacteriota bacterium]
MNRPAIRISLLFSTVILLTLIYTSCRKLDTPFIVDEDNIMLYIELSEDGRELFRTDELYSDSPFTVAGDTAIYRLIVDSVQRNTDLTVSPRGGQLKDYRIGTDPLRDAELVVDDIFYGKMFRMAGAETTHVDRKWGFTRKGLFLKLGADDRDFVGWKLWGYNGGLDALGPPISLLFTRSNGIYFSYPPPGGDRFTWYFPRPSDGSVGDTVAHYTLYRYTRLDQYPIIAKGEKLAVQGQVPDRTVQLLLNGSLQSGYDVQQIKQPTVQYFIDSVRTASANSRHWNVFTLTQKKAFV